MASAWRNFKNIFSRPLFTIIFRPEMLKFDPYFILAGETMVGFVVYYVLNDIFSGNCILLFISTVENHAPPNFCPFQKTICTLIINSFS